MIKNNDRLFRINFVNQVFQCKSLNITTIAFAIVIVPTDYPDAISQLQRFITQYPASPYKPEAVRLACETNWVNGACGSDSDLKGINNGNSSSPPAKSGYASG